MTWATVHNLTFDPLMIATITNEYEILYLPDRLFLTNSQRQLEMCAQLCLRPDHRTYKDSPERSRSKNEDLAESMNPGSQTNFVMPFERDIDKITGRNTLVPAVKYRTVNKSQTIACNKYLILRHGEQRQQFPWRPSTEQLYSELCMGFCPWAEKKKKKKRKGLPPNSNWRFLHEISNNLLRQSQDLLFFQPPSCELQAHGDPMHGGRIIVLHGNLVDFRVRFEAFHIHIRCLVRTDPRRERHRRIIKNVEYARVAHVLELTVLGCCVGRGRP
ncbi:hypothetical protein KC351_g8 [Hortaea werneckii]|nr:hypothetical protein KC351_g8 [Hortaea werneckii]